MKRKAAIIMAAVGAVIAGIPLASMAECYIYKFTTQPVMVESQPVTVRRFVDRVQPVVTLEAPVQIERTLSEPVLMNHCVEAPVVLDSCAPSSVIMETKALTPPVMLDSCATAKPIATVLDHTVSRPVLVEHRSLSAPVMFQRTLSKPVLVESRTVSRPVIFERTMSSPVVIERSLSNPTLLDRPVRLTNKRYINRAISSAVTMSSSRGEVIQTLRTLGLPIVVDRNDLDDWDTIKIKRKKILGVRQPVLELKD